MRKSIDLPDTLLTRLYKLREDKYSTLTLGQMIVVLLIGILDRDGVE